MSGDEGTMSSFVYCFVELFVVFLCLPIPFLPQNDPIFIGPRYLGIINFWTFPVQVDKNGDHVENAGISYKIHPSFKFSYVKPNTPEIHLFPQKYCNLCTWFDCPAPDHPWKICTFLFAFKGSGVTAVQSVRKGARLPSKLNQPVRQIFFAGETNLFCRWDKSFFAGETNLFCRWDKSCLETFLTVFLPDHFFAFVHCQEEGCIVMYWDVHPWRPRYFPA